MMAFNVNKMITEYENEVKMTVLIYCFTKIIT